jgi:integrase/recombinase XerD
MLAGIGFPLEEAHRTVASGDFAMTELRCRMMADMKLHGLAPGTQKVYLKCVERLARYFHRSPDRLSEQDLRDYFIYLAEKKRVRSSTLRTAIFGVKFLFDKTLQRPWPTLKFLRARPSYKLPVVLDRSEAQRVISLIECPTVRMCATLIYSCGLRISEALGLEVRDIDSARMVVIVRAGKGNKDRHVPLPQRTLELLRDYWRAYRPQTCLLVTEDGRPLNQDRVRYYLKRALNDSGICKRVSSHTLRHSYATNLMEQGLDVRVIQTLLGHRSLKTTTLYLHMTQSILRSVQEAVNGLTADL